MPGPNRRLLITGASGDLGRPLSSLAVTRWQTTGTYFRSAQVGGGQPVRLDLRDAAGTQQLVDDLRPNVIIHAATSDRSEQMVAANRKAARNITTAARAVSARLIALSTDMVFDGTKPPYSEGDPPAPLSAYGHVKAENEAFFLEHADNCLIVRTSLIYDFAPANRQAGWLLEAARGGETVNLFVDEMRSPVWAWNLAEALLELAETDVTGILHVAGPEATSRWALGAALLEALGFSPTAVAVPVLAAKVAPHRPRDLTLSIKKAQRILSTSLLSLAEARAEAQAR